MRNMVFSKYKSRLNIGTFGKVNLCTLHMEWTCLIFEIKLGKLRVHGIKQRGGVDHQFYLPGFRSLKQGK